MRTSPLKRFPTLLTISENTLHRIFIFQLASISKLFFSILQKFIHCIAFLLFSLSKPIHELSFNENRFYNDSNTISENVTINHLQCPINENFLHYYWNIHKLLVFECSNTVHLFGGLLHILQMIDLINLWVPLRHF